MSNNRQGFFWHVHHETLIEWCHGYNERAEYIRIGKPKNERKTRLRLFKPVKGNLPEEVIEAWRACVEAKQVYDKVYRAYNKAYRARVRTGRAHVKTRQAYHEAWQARDEAYRAYKEAVNKNMPAIKALHAEECPGCPWDGYTIFPDA